MKVEQKTIRLTEEESKTLWRAEMLCRGIENEVNKIIDLRVHILLAKAFLYNPNPKIYKIVGHKDNDKHNNDLSNLYWTTNQENTQKAVDDGLNKNKIAQDNENSNFVKVLDKDTLEIVGIYGSYRECNRCIENSTLGSISRILC